MKFPHTVTLFNKYKNNGKTLYNKTVIKDVLFVTQTATGTLVAGKNIPANTTTVYIPKIADFGNKKFVLPQEYEVNPVSNTFTFGEGDYIALGDVDLGSMTPSEFKQRYGRLFEIDGYTDYDFGNLKNFVVVCK